HAEEVVRAAPRGSAPWVRGMLVKLRSASSTGRVEESMAALEALRTIEPSMDAVAPLALALGLGIYVLDRWGQIQEANAVVERLRAVVDAMGSREPIASAVLIGLDGVRNGYAKEDPWNALNQVNASLAIYRAIGHLRYIDFMQ